ncbi:MAG TPA: acetylglutamate kinase [Gemmatimonadaceae bacterium]|nr:acetylglutamate kinase [Gemmatimonadaceae bacterium]
MMRVVKLGGRVQQNEAVQQALAAAWNADPGSLCIVHGGGDEISALQRAFGMEPRFVGGRRVTSPDEINLVRMALSGSANKRLVAALQGAGAPAVGISGEDGRLLIARESAGGALGRVGEPAAVHAELIEALLNAGFLPVISPLASAEDGSGALNVNGDDAAAAFATALGADELMLVVDVQGVVDGGVVIPVLDAESAAGLIAAGTAAGGMVAKLEAAIRALEAGVPRVRIGGVAALSDPSSGTALMPARSLV